MKVRNTAGALELGSRAAAAENTGVPGGVASTHICARAHTRAHTPIGNPPELLSRTATQRKGPGLAPSKLTPHLVCTSPQVTRGEGAQHAGWEGVQGQEAGQALRQRVGL